MAKKKVEEVEPTEGAPYAANWIIDEAQRPENLIERHGKTASSPQVHDAYRKIVEEKAASEGLIHIDPATGYRARFKVPAA